MIDEKRVRFMWNRNKIVYYHEHCPGGRAAAAVYRNAGGQGGLSPWSHGDKFPEDLAGLGIVFLDICPSKAEIEELFRGGAATVLVVDHHRLAHRLAREITPSNFERFEDLTFVTDYKPGPCSVAKMTWMYFMQSDGSDMPDSIDVFDEDIIFSEYDCVDLQAYRSASI